MILMKKRTFNVINAIVSIVCGLGCASGFAIMINGIIKRSGPSVIAQGGLLGVVLGVWFIQTIRNFRK